MNLTLKILSTEFVAFASPCFATGIPVADAANLSQNLQHYIETLAQGVQQLTDYALQMKQYENELLRYDEMVKNRIAPAIRRPRCLPGSVRRSNFLHGRCVLQQRPVQS